MFGSKNKDNLQAVIERRNKTIKETDENKPKGTIFTSLLPKDDVDTSGIPRVYNEKGDPYPDDAVYIGRGTSYGNPYTVLSDGGREMAIKKYTDYLFQNPELLEMVRRDLKGKNLLCHCTPLPCHGDVLLLVANPELDFNNKFTNYKPDPVVEPATDTFQRKVGNRFAR